jgi:hypothetical protein
VLVSAFPSVDWIFVMEVNNLILQSQGRLTHRVRMGKSVNFSPDIFIFLHVLIDAQVLSIVSNENAC